MILPSLEIGGGLPLALARGLTVAGLFGAFGSALARVVVLPPALARLGAEAAEPLERRCRRLTGAALALAAVALAAWSWLIAGTLADPPDLAGTAAALPVLLGETMFGHVALAQLGMLTLAGLALARRYRRAAAWLGAVAVVLQAGHGHAAAMSEGPSLLLLSDALHVLAGAAWLGELLLLLLLVAAAPAEGAALACRRFARLGTACVAVLVVTAGFQAWTLIGGLPRLLGTGYGLMALLKAVLFAGLLGLAAWHRWRLTPALSGGAAEMARRRMRRGIAVEIALGLLLVLAAGTLASLPPAIHMQPVWPMRLP